MNQTKNQIKLIYKNFEMKIRIIFKIGESF